MASSNDGVIKKTLILDKKGHSNRKLDLGFIYSRPFLTKKMKNVNLKSQNDETELREANSNAAGRGHSGLPLRPHAEDCAYYMRTGSCRFGSKCKFNHPLVRPILKVDHEEAGTETGSDENSDKSSVACKFYLMRGGCKNGESCKYLHPKPEPEMVSGLNFMGLPVREGEKECPFYMRTGMCGYGQNCRFNHPDPTPIGVSDSYSTSLNAEAEEYHGRTAGFVSQEPFSRPLSGSSSIPSSWPSCIIPNYSGFHMDSPVSYMPAPCLYSEGFHQTTEGSGYQVSGYPEEKKSPSSILAEKTKMDKMDLSKVAEASKEEAERKSYVPLPFPPPPTTREPIELNELGLPLRPGKEICWYHENWGLCRKGRVCPFDHPMDKRSKNLPNMSKSGTKEVTPDEDDEYKWNAR